ncbi:MAG: hypothetical protein ACYS72_01850 [Planctomycetota bacterium]|jgi:hypothetical protein
MPYKKSISSKLTLFDKFILPIITLLALVFLAVYFHFYHPHAFVTLWMPLLIGVVYTFFYSIPLKRVMIQGDELIVSNFIKEITIHMSEIEKVTENYLMPNRPVTIHLKHKSEFGKKILFNPPLRIIMEFSEFFNSRPIVEELRRLSGCSE